MLWHPGAQICNKDDNDYDDAIMMLHSNVVFPERAFSYSLMVIHFFLHG